MIAANNASIPGNNELDAVSLWAAWLQGKVAMIYSWPPTGRMTAGYSQSDKAINFVPQSHDRRQGRLRRRARAIRSMPPATTRRSPPTRPIRTPPICSCSGHCSPPVSLARCMLPYALRDPYRISHFKSDLYGAALARRAKDYLANLNNSANVGLLDPIMPGAQDYFVSLDRMCTSVWAGADPKTALETAAAEWDATTERLGVDSQKAFYAEFLKLPGATADNTVEKLGMAVKLD